MLESRFISSLNDSSNCTQHLSMPKAQKKKLNFWWWQQCGSLACSLAWFVFSVAALFRLTSSKLISFFIMRFKTRREKKVPGELYTPPSESRCQTILDQLHMHCCQFSPRRSVKQIDGGLRDICRRRSIEDGGEKIKIRFLMKNLGKNELQFEDLKWKKAEWERKKSFQFHRDAMRWMLMVYEWVMVAYLWWSSSLRKGLKHRAFQRLVFFMLRAEERR